MKIHLKSNLKGSLRNIVLNFIFKASVEDLVRISGSFKEGNSVIHMEQHSYTESSFKILLNGLHS